MSLCTFHREIIHSDIGRIILGSYRNGSEPDVEYVVKRLSEKMQLDDDILPFVAQQIEYWKAHFDRKRDEYVQKSKYVSWLTDATYDLEID